MDDFKVMYDEKSDILYLAKKGAEEEVIEVSPGVNLELDMEGKLIGIELFNASSLFKDILSIMQKKLQAA